jgi:hypothetical protein
MCASCEGELCPCVAQSYCISQSNVIRAFGGHRSGCDEYYRVGCDVMCQ